jgi:hypothetical protein
VVASGSASAIGSTVDRGLFGFYFAGGGKMEAIYQPYTFASKQELVGGALGSLNDWQKRF